MKLLVVGVFAVIIAVAVAHPQEYSSKFDNVNVDSILKNDRIVTNYIKCLLDKGPCTQEGRELKKTLPDAIRTDCKKCTPVQKKNTEKVIQHLKEKKQRDWKDLIAKYDPEGKGQAKYNL